MVQFAGGHRPRGVRQFVQRPDNPPADEYTGHAGGQQDGAKTPERYRPTIPPMAFQVLERGLREGGILLEKRDLGSPAQLLGPAGHLQESDHFAVQDNGLGGHPVPAQGAKQLLRRSAVAVSQALLDLVEQQHISRQGQFAGLFPGFVVGLVVGQHLVQEERQGLRLEVLAITELDRVPNAKGTGHKNAKDGNCDEGDAQFAAERPCLRSSTLPQAVADTVHRPQQRPARQPRGPAWPSGS